MEENGEKIVCFERICRLCLNDRQTLTEIFEPTTDNNNFSIDQKIMACATIALSKDDGLPSRICVKCLTAVNAAFEFRIQCENADKTLRILHNLLTGEGDAIKSDKVITSVDAIIASDEESQDAAEENTGKENIDLEQVILLKKGENEDKLEEDKGNLFFIIKDNDGGVTQGMLSDAEVIYFDNGDNADVAPAEDAGCKIVTGIEGINEEREVLEDEEEEGEENAEEKGEEVQGEAAENEMAEGEAADSEMVDEEAAENEVAEREEADCDSMDFELNTDSSGENSFRLLINSSADELVSNNEQGSQASAVKINGDELEKAPCPFCHKMLTRVEEHIRLMHRNRIYICNKFGCGAQFATLKNLQSHQLTCYDVQKGYKCPYCFKEFHRKSNFKAHVKRHNSRKEFKCQLCDAAFVDTTGLRRHFLKHHEPEREMFISDCCGKSFKSKEGLRKHINKRICGIQVLEVVDPSPIEVPM